MQQILNAKLNRYIGFLLLILLFGCGGGGGSGGGNGPTPPPANVTLQSITVSTVTNTGPIGIGQTVQYKATANYSNQTQQDVTSSASWATSNSSVASINSAGLATAISAGSVSVTASYQDISSSVKLVVGSLIISNSKALALSMPLSQTNTAFFQIQNLTDSATFDLSSAAASVNGAGTATIDSTQTTCGTSIAPNSNCIYAVDYSSSSNVSDSGSLVDVVLQINAGSTGTIQASTTTFVANGTSNLQGTGLVPTKVVIIYNSDPTHTIYPVVETSRKLAPNFDTWLMSFFGRPHSPTAPIYISGVYRIYIGGTNGIQPGQYAAIPLPLYSSFTSVQSNGDSYIDWWRGTRFYIYDNPVGVQLHMGINDTLINNSALVAPVSDTKVCTVQVFNELSCSNVASVVYQDNIDSAFPPNDPAQLVEPSLGSDGGIGNYVWAGTEIDYDVSYVNDLYMPISLGKIDYSDQTLGWVGTNSSISLFQQRALASPFMSLNSPANGVWPVYTYSQAITNVLSNTPANGQVHIPSAIQTLPNPYAPMGLNQVPVNGLNFVYNRQLTNNQWMVTSGSSVLPYVQDIIQSWQNGINNGDTNVVTIWNAFVANYAANCPSAPQPVSLSYAIANIVGFASFGECQNGAASAGIPLPNASTPQGLALINAYHTAMDDPNQTLNPWVNFIHGQLGLQSVYAYSIDDILGNVQTTGDGFMIEVGGASAQQNPIMMESGGQTIQLSFDGANPPTTYAYTGASMCGRSLIGTIPFSKNGVNGNAIIATGAPIYASAVTNGNSCVVQMDGVMVQPQSVSGTTYPIGTLVHATYTIANVDTSGTSAAANALTTSMRASCTDNIGGLFCNSLNASNVSTAVLYTIAWAS